MHKTKTKRTTIKTFFSSIFSYFPHQFVHCRDSDVQLAEIVRMFHPGKHFFQILLIDQSYSLIRMQIDYYEVYKQLNGTETSWQDISPAQLSFCPPRAQYQDQKFNYSRDHSRLAQLHHLKCIRNLVTSTHPVLLHSQKAKKEVAVRSAVVDVTL